MLSRQACVPGGARLVLPVLDDGGMFSFSFMSELFFTQRIVAVADACQLSRVSNIRDLRLPTVTFLTFSIVFYEYAVSDMVKVYFVQAV